MNSSDISRSTIDPRHQARKALRALKGVIRLQAIIRGQAVRRQVIRSLKNVPSNAKIQKENQDISSHTEEENYKNRQIYQLPKQKKKIEEDEPKAECYSQRTWNCSSHSREDIEAIWLRKQEAIIKRDRMRQYSPIFNLMLSHARRHKLACTW